MSEVKHTPGPWRTDTDIFHDRLDIRDESGRRIAVCMHDYPMSMARHDANAHLIAAAPEMLEELEYEQAECRERLSFENCNACIACKSCSLLRVINKAKGKENV